MEIGPLGNRNQSVVSTGASSPKRKEPVSGVGKSDTLELSLTARQYLADLADKALTAELSAETTRKDDGDTSERTDRIRRATEKMESGFYLSTEVKGRIADKLVEQFYQEEADE